MITNLTSSINNAASLSTSIHPAPITNKSSTSLANKENTSIMIKQPELTSTAQLDQLRNAVDKIEKFSQAASQNLKFSIDEDTGRTVIKVINATTDEIVRQIPSKEVLEIANSLSKINGILFNGHA